MEISDFARLSMDCLKRIAEIVADVKQSSFDPDLCRLKRDQLKALIEDFETDLDAAVKAEKHDAEQNLRGRGLGNTTIYDNILRATERDANRESEKVTREFNRALEEIAIFERNHSGTNVVDEAHSSESGIQPDVMRILIVAASPLDQDRIRLSAEVRDIKHALQRSRNREEWSIESNEAVRVDDLRRALLDFRPTVVHFSGHGNAGGELCFEDDDGYSRTTDIAPLGRLLHHFKDHVKCVVLNACFSQGQGKVICQEIDYVVGMRTEVADATALKFAVAFYDAVFAGTDFRTAFDLGCTAVDLDKLPDSDVPVLMTSPHLEGRSLSYDANIPEVERVLYGYFNTEYADRYRFTTSGESILERMKQFYGAKILRAVDKVQVLGIKAVGADHWRVLVKIYVEDTSTQGVFYLCIRNRAVQIEWEASVGLWSTPPTTYVAMGSAKPVVARVRAQLDDYYNYEFADESDRFQSVALKALSGKRFYGYVERNSELFDQLTGLLSDGNSHEVTLELTNPSDKGDIALIQKLLSRTWLHHDS